MSGRTTNSQGYAFLDEDEDTSPVESDAMGGNAGISHPYTRTRPPRGNPNGTNRATVHGIGEDEPNYVNGQQVTATLDGMEVPLATAMSMLQNGSAIPASLAPYQNLPGFSFQSNGLGLFNVNIPRQVGWNVTYNGANDTRGTASPVYMGSNNFTWNSQQQSGQQRVLRWGTSHIIPDENTLPGRIDEILKDPRIQSPECTKAFEAIKATPIIDQLLAGNITFVSESVFMNPEFDNIWGADEEIASGVRAEANNHIRRFFGIGPQVTGEIEAADITPIGEHKGKRDIPLTNYGIKQKLDHLSVAIIHSLIHSGGAPGKTYSGSHDLIYLGKKYDDIIKACQKNKSRVKDVAGLGEGEQ